MGEQAQNDSQQPPGPSPIQRLHESLINRIAAGEIIHRPASALKELLENCLDAGATSIRITVKDGGMKLLQIQDNGCGIHKSDLPILAERFTTSKIKSFSDLSRLTTYGFRGEALASISHVAHMSVVTKTKTDSCAWKACYSEGVLVPPKAGQTPDPKPCAGIDGTTIVIEDMFYSTPTRLSALRSPSEEYARILDVVTKYAVHNSKVAFLCKKAGSVTPELSTSPTSIDQAIRLLYGHAIGKELLHIEVSSSSTDGTSRPIGSGNVDNSEKWSAEAYCTSPNYQAKKTVFLLFINHRLVESSSVKRAIESVYSGVLPKGAFPFVYLSLEIDPRSVDVNVHPTKREVIFLNEEIVTERISDAIQQVVSQSHSRTFEYQTLLPGRSNESNAKVGRKAREEEGGEEEEEDEDEEERPASSHPTKLYPHHKVRTSLHDRTLESMIPVLNPSRSDGDDVSKKAVGLRDIPESSCDLTSILELRKLVQKSVHHDLTEIIKKHTFVGIVDDYRCLSLIQHATKLYLVNHAALAEEMFYQLALMQFGSYRRLKLDPPPPLRTLIKLAVDAEPGTEKSGLSKNEIVDRIAKTLVSRRSMLAEYFEINITSDGEIETLPHLMKEYTPDLNKLPAFLMRLGPQVQWQSEKGCFSTLMRELAYFYSPSPSHFIPWMPDGVHPQAKAATWQTEHVLFQATRKFLVAPRSLLENDVVQVANLPDLYRVFERC
ncbi:DNA mismatch repair protein MutL [Imleria badia]|nr:DNA mismatch repair protein MutL [Imleria badia]